MGAKFFFAESRRAGKRRAETLTEFTFPSNSEILDIVEEAKTEAVHLLAKLGVTSGVPDVFSSIPEVEPDDEDEWNSEEENEVGAPAG